MSLVQVVSSNLPAPGLTQTTPAAATTPNNLLLFFAVYNAINAGVPTPSDSTARTWTQVPGSPFSGNATGLMLAVWSAQASGNAANTFTLATTGSDTPSIFIAEVSGRDRFAPILLTVQASDIIASSGPHVTGSILANGGDDLVAFNVAGALAQSFTAGGSWAIPPNGAVTAPTGYDAFLQYQNSVQPGAVPNVYAVSISDKLDAFIVSLLPPMLPYGDECLDWFNDVPEESLIDDLNSQLLDLVTSPFDIDIDWVDDAGDNDVWVLVENQSTVVGAGVIPNIIAQYYGEDAELLDEVLDLVAFPGSVQNINNFPPIILEEPWDWFQEIDDDEWAYRDAGTLSGDAPDAVSLVFTDGLDWDEDPDDFFADDFGNDDADLPQNDAWDYWLTDDDEYWVDDYFTNINFNPALLFLNLEDGWDQEHFTTSDDDATWTEDVYENDPNSLLTVEDPTWWDEEPDQFDGTTHDLDAVGPNDNPAVTVSDGFDHFSTDGDDYVIIDDYALVNVVPNTVLTVDDAYGWFPSDPDDELFHTLNTDPVGQTLITPFAMPPEDPWDQTQADDDWIVPDDYVIINVVPSAQFPISDGWDQHWPTDDDDYLVLDEYQPGNNKPIIVEDQWQHWLTDPDDELFLGQDLSPVTVPQPAAIDDPVDHWTQDSDDQEWLFRNTDPVEPLRGLQIQDTYDHWLTDGDDWVVPDDYALINNIPPPSQFTDDNFDWFYEPAEDNEQDYAVTDGPLVKSVYLLNPYFEVFIPLRPFTVTWGADADV